MRRTALTLLTSAAATAAVLTTVSPASATTPATPSGLVVTGLTSSDRLVTFAADDARTVLSETKIKHLTPKDDVVAIDYRPATGGLYALVTSKSEGVRLFLVDPATGAATRVGTTTYDIAGEISIDFNPTVDRLRVVSDQGTNLRVNPNDGALAATDGPLAYAAGDPAAGQAPGVAGVAYTNNDNDPATATTLYDVDAALDQLAVQNPPNNGTLVTVGPLGQPTKAQATGFDIYTNTVDDSNRAFVSLFQSGRPVFYEIDLATGAPIGEGQAIRTSPRVTDIALAPAQAGA